MKTICTLALAILSAGLISCSADNKKQESAPRADTWPVPDIVLLRKDGDRVKEFKKIEHEGETTDWVEFKFENPEHAKTIKSLTAESECTPAGAKDPVLKNAYAVAGDKFRFFDSLSNDLLARSDEKVKCTFKIVISNSIGSTITYELLRLTLDRSREDKLLLISGFERFRSSKPIEAKEFKDVRIDGTSQQASLAVYCSKFRASLETKQLSSTRLSDLLHQPVKLDEGVVDPRIAHPIQTCQLISRDSSPAKSAAISSSFQVDFGQHVLSALADVVTGDAGGMANAKTTLYRMTVRNDNPVAVSIALPREAGTARVSTLYRGWFAPDWGVKMPPQTVRLSLEPRGETVLTADGVLTVTIPAKSSIEILVTAASPANRCMKMRYFGGKHSLDASVDVGLIGGIYSIDGLKALTFPIGAEPAAKDRAFIPHGTLDVSGIFKTTEFYQTWERPAGPVPANYYDKPMQCL